MFVLGIISNELLKLQKFVIPRPIKRWMNHCDKSYIIYPMELYNGLHSTKFEEIIEGLFLS